MDSIIGRDMVTRSLVTGMTPILFSSIGICCSCVFDMIEPPRKKPRAIISLETGDFNGIS